MALRPQRHLQTMDQADITPAKMPGVVQASAYDSSIVAHS